MKLIGVDQFRAATRTKRKTGAGVFRVTVGEPKAYDDGSRRVRFCFSDGSVDRMGDTIDPAGWNTHAFMRNPVALWAHDSSAPPIGRADNVMVEDLRLMGDIEFAPPEIYPFAETIYRMVVGKFINACSVGFMPIEYDWSDDDDREWGLDFKRQELLEISVCPVPANGNALAEARAKGIDTRPLVEWAEKTLDGGGKIVIPRAELERLRKAAKEPPVTRRTPAKPHAHRRDLADSAGETDPAAAGGTLVGNCGRPGDDECGMKDPAECSIHGFGGVGVGSETDEEKRINAIVERALAKALPKLVARLAPKPRQRSDEDPNAEGEGSEDRPDLPDGAEKCVRMAHMHMKAMGDALEVANDHFDNAMDQLDTVKDALDASPPSDDGLGAGADPEGEKAARIRRARERRQKLGLN